MNKPVIAIKPLPWLLFIWLAFFSVQAFAAVDSTGVLNNVLIKFETAAATWKTIMITRATWLFWLLVVISMVWTFGFMALRKADIGELFAEFIRFTIFTGFFWWLLLNGPDFAISIIKSLRMIGAQASGLPNDLGPSGIVDMGFDIFFKVLDQSTVWKPMDSLFGMLLGAAILLMFALIGVNMLLLLVSGYLFAYAGVFILGFGGSKWTSEMAIGYYKSILNIAIQLMAMVLIIGIGRSFIDEYYTAMSSGVSLKEMGVMVVVAACMLFLVAKIPPQLGALAGGSTGSLGSNFGAGAAVAAAAMGAAAVASAGAAVAAGAASGAGGASALMSAFSKASAAEAAGGGGGSSALMAAAGGTGGDSGGSGSGGGSALGAAMGDSTGGGGGSTGSGDSGSSESGSSSGSSGSGSGGGESTSAAGADSQAASSGGADSGTGGGSASADGGASSQASSSGGADIGTDGGSAGANGGAASLASSEGGSASGGSDTGSSANSESSKSSSGAGSGSGDKAAGGKASRLAAAAGAMAAKAGRIAAGTATNLAQGSYDVAKERALEIKESAKERIAGTTGGKIAAAIDARRQAAETAGTAPATFEGNSLAGARSAEAEEEIAAFRDGKSKTS
ncbi:P-type conjugative transfer protein TrbL [Janthinobacterium sp. CG3]|uniref:P-type conjugative transfer protein TrbL n=1 Tax=Janthinobacterium sp. CG3 TaxID=1075768 RepID=UPI0003483511|nr:P-type conjugative transfer protein TrbL [Janthinobacterium sp. CG3]